MTAVMSLANKPGFLPLFSMIAQYYQIQGLFLSNNSSEWLFSWKLVIEDSYFLPFEVWKVTMFSSISKPKGQKI